MPAKQDFGGVPFPKRIRLARSAYERPDSIFHLIINAHPEVTEFPMAMRDALWDSLIQRSTVGGIVLHVACLMPNHLHLVVQPDGDNLLDVVRDWKSRSTRLSWQFGHHGSLWQPEFWDRTIRTTDDLVRTRDYVLDNPVRAGFVSDWREWRWSFAAEDGD